MKRYIQCSNTEIPITIHISIDVYLYNTDTIAAAEGADVFERITNDDGSVNSKALGAWELFVQRVALQFSPIFKIVKIERSPVYMSLTSRYFWVYARNEDNTINTEILLRLRLSDHDYVPGHDSQSEFTPVNDLGQKLKPPYKISGQNIELAGIVVQSKDLGVENSFNTYTEAVKYVDAMARSIKKEYLDDRYLNGGEPDEDWDSKFNGYKPRKYTKKQINKFTESYRKSHNISNDK